MSQKFITFLGTGPYKVCRYLLDGKISNDVIFIQEVIIKEICKNFTKDDEILIFLDDGAKQANWNSLTQVLRNLGLKCKITDIDITEDIKNDIWAIFELIYNHLEINDSLFFDVTHSFRYLPIVCFSVLSYAKYLKNIHVKGIYYGAFELRDKDKNISPIINLVDCYNLMEWANAADLFTNYGITDKLKKIVDGTTANTYHDESRKLVFNINSITKNMNCNRGQKIIEGNLFKNCSKQIKEISQENILPAFKPILEKVQAKIENFSLNSPNNFLPATKWYLKHDMIPQGITMLQEGLITWLLSKYNLDFQDRLLRETISALLSKRFDNKTEWIPPRNYETYKLQAETIMNDKNYTLFCPIYKKITEIRNDVNHGGFRKNSMSPELIKEKMQIYYEEIKSIIDLETD